MQVFHKPLFQEHRWFGCVAAATILLAQFFNQPTLIQGAKP